MKCDPNLRIHPNIPNEEFGVRNRQRLRFLEVFGTFGCNSEHSDRAKGFAIIELLVYIAAFSLALFAIANTVIVMTRSYTVVRSTSSVERNISALERIAREIRGSRSVSDGDSMFGAHPGRLFLNTTDIGGAPRTVLFYLDGGALVLKENNGAPQPLTAKDVSVTSLVFRKIVTPHSVGVKIELTLESGSGASFYRENFYDTVVLRDTE